MESAKVAKKKPLGPKIITITKCGECPFSNAHCGGRKTVCEHIKIVVPHPYSNDREVDPEKIADFCPL